MAQIGVDGDRPPLNKRGRVLFDNQASIDALIAREEVEWEFRMTIVADRREIDELRASEPPETLFVAILRADDRLSLFSSGSRPHVDEGDLLITYGARKSPTDEPALLPSGPGAPRDQD